MRILIDMDGVIADMTSHWCRLMNEHYGEQLSPLDVVQWDLHKACKVVGKKEAYGVLKEPGFFRYLPVMPGAVAAIQEMLQNGHEVYIVTACLVGGYDDKMAWIKRHFPFLVNNVVATHCKYLVQGDVFIDDKIENLEKWQAHNKSGMAICFNQPYNQAWNRTRLNQWSDLLMSPRHLQGITNGGHYWSYQHRSH